MKNPLRKLRCGTPALAVRACLLVSLALCHSPIPLVHRHQGPEQARAESDAASDEAKACDCWLARHLAIFHPDAKPGREDEFGWHLHLLFPRSSPGDDDSSRGGRSAPIDHWWTAGLQGSVDSLAQNGRWPLLGDARVDDGCGAQAASGKTRPSSGRHFLETYLSSVAARELICVALC